MRFPQLSLIAFLTMTSVAAADPEMNISPPPGTWQVSNGTLLPYEHGILVPSELESEPCLTEEERAFAQDEVAKNRRRLIAQGILRAPDPLAPATVPALLWPLKAAPDFTDGNNAAITAFVDHGSLVDWNCGTRTIAGHRGTDFYIYPLPWYKMDHDCIEIVAAAAGTIILKVDGNYDRSCAMNTNDANKIYLQHDDGSMTTYVHMKINSLTSKGVGERVEAGEYLGVVGSSGNSTGPHLHMEVYDSEGGLVDPYFGPCNSMNASSLWAVQEPYVNSSILRVRSHSALPVTPPCPGQEILNELRDWIQPGTSLVFLVYYRDWAAGMTSQYRMLQPDGEEWLAWSYTPGSYYNHVSYYATRTLPQNAQTGVWWFEATLGSQTERWAFGVNTAVPTAVSPVPGLSPRLRHWPNPSSSSTTISFELPREDMVELAVFDVSGRRVRTLLSHANMVGPCDIVWDGRDDNGRNVSTGVYFYRLKGRSFTEARKMTIIR